jgi:hypothetical protein
MDTKLFSRKQSGGMFSILDREQFPTGSIWWVDSTNTTNGANGAGYGQNPDAPFLTWVYAVAAAGAGDTIFLMPGHTETIGVTGAAAITLALAGLKTIGLGGRTLKPQILIDGFADTYVSITAADTVLENITFKAGHADIAMAVNVAAAGVEIRGCNFEENVATENFLIAILTTNAADDLLIEGCFITSVDASGTEAIEIVGACNRVVIKDNYIKGPYSVSAISATTAACLDMQILNNRIINTLAGDDLAGCVDLFASSTGMIANNCLYMEDNTDILTCVDSANLGRVNNLAATTTLLASTTTVAGALNVNSDAVRLAGMVNAIAFVLDVSAAATDAADTLDVKVQTKLDGTNWVDVIHFTQCVGNGGAKRYFEKLVADVACAGFENAAALGAGNTRDLLGDEWRVNYVQVDADSDASFSFSVIAIPM